MEGNLMKSESLFSTENIVLLQESTTLSEGPGIHPYAQTNIQLYKQLQAVGYSVDDITVVWKAYDLAKELFACLYCPSGKTYLAHVVGVGSILGSLGLPINVVVAGLLHGVYECGDFGEGWSLDRKKGLVQQTVGPQIDHDIGAYQDLEWTRFTIPVIRNSVTHLRSSDRDVLAMRLASELEDLLDGGILFCSDAESRQQHFRDLGYLHVNMAELLDYPTLAEEFKNALHYINRSPSIPPLSPKGVRISSDPFRVLPPSYTYRSFRTIRKYIDTGVKRVTKNLLHVSMVGLMMGPSSLFSLAG